MQTGEKEGVHMESTATLLGTLAMVARFVLPVFALVVLYRCVRSMLSGRADPEIWGYLVTPKGEVSQLRHWECIIGRARSSDVRLNFEDVAGVHAVLMRNDKGEWHIHDLSRGGGVHLNGKQLEDTEQLVDGDIIRCGKHMLKFATNTEQHRALQERKREVAGWKINAGTTLFFLTLCQLLLMLEFYVSLDDEYRITALLAFFALILVQWLCYLVMRTLDRSGYEPETLAFFLCTLGLSVCATATPDELVRQTILLIAGVVLFFLFGWWLRDLNHVKAMRWPLAFLSLALLVLNLAAAQEMFGAKNWITVAGFSLQPSELIKVAYIYVGATTLDQMFRSKSILYFIGFSAICVGGLALMGDMGAALVFFATFLVIAFLRSGSIATVLLAVGGAAMAGMLVLSIKPYVARRFATWGHVWEDVNGAGYQQTRALSAAASGGLFGQGAGNGWLKHIVAANTDMVFAMVCEELGLIIAVFAMLSIIALAIFTVKNAARNRSSYYVIAGCAAVTMMMVQMALNVFGSLDILPFTGVTFPFVSRGGSSMLSCWMLLAFIKSADTRRGGSFVVKAGAKQKEADAA